MRKIFKVSIISFVIIYVIIYYSIPYKTTSSIKEKSEEKILTNEKSLAIVQVSNNRNSHISNRFINNKENYTKFHNYGYFVENPAEPSRLPTWNKLKATLKAFKNDYKWVRQLDKTTSSIKEKSEEKILTNEKSLAIVQVSNNKNSPITY